jgi:hypothetical protein
MRSNRERLILVAVLTTAVASSRAAAEPAAGEEAVPAPAQPTPKLAAPAPARAAQAPLWREGFMVIPAIGIHSFQGSSAENTGPGLRLGLLAGSRMAELLSLNVGFAFDKANLETPNTSAYIFDVGFNPLFHFPQERLEIVAGPVGGIFLNKGSAGGGGQTADIWEYGWTVGANAGLFFRVGSKVHLGGLLNFFLRNPMKSCVTANGTDTCLSSGLNSQKAFALSLAAML